MLSSFYLSLATIYAYGVASALAAASLAGPSVTLDSATFVGVKSGSVEKYLGIPFAEPPTGNNRFRLPVPLPPYTGTHTVTAFGPACPQQAVDLPLDKLGVIDDAIDSIVNTLFGVVFPDSEDCLTINVVRPAGISATAKLPVVAWIFGGGFQLGSPSMYDGSSIVSRSVALGQPVIYVSMNYRVSAFGFLAGKEVKDAKVGNLGLQDQRESFRWIQKYIGAFGGDPTKVTIWGESAGAISAALHMVANNGNHEGLFRGAFMQSGSPIPVGDITNGQIYYDALVRQTGCSGAADTLDCLRKVDYKVLKAAADLSPGIFSYQSLILAWLPRADGVFLTGNPQQLVVEGKVAKIPIINGDCEDEGTLFSLSTLNVTTSAQLKTYLSTIWLPGASSATIDKAMELYPASLIEGSPFGTGILNALTPQSKRFAAFQGDAVFQAPRRFFLQAISGKQPVWSYIHRRLKLLPILGSLHASDILNVYFGGDMADYLIRFTNTLNPNGDVGKGINWPKYTTATPNLLSFNDGILFPLTITQDTFRKEAMEFVTQLTLDHPI